MSKAVGKSGPIRVVRTGYRRNEGCEAQGEKQMTVLRVGSQVAEKAAAASATQNRPFLGPAPRPHPGEQGQPGVAPWRRPIWAGASQQKEQSKGIAQETGGQGAQTYLRSAEWAAMRFLRLLSARGQPERLKEKRWDMG